MVFVLFTFFVGELKKMLSGPTGLHHQDQKLLYKDKERDSNAFLDMAGVKDRSKIVVMEDPISQEKRYLEMRRNAKMEKASKSISEISLEVDRLAGQVLYERRVSFLPSSTIYEFENGTMEVCSFIISWNLIFVWELGRCRLWKL